MPHCPPSPDGARLIRTSSCWARARHRRSPVRATVTVKPHASPQDVAQRIKAALHRSADADAKKVQVTATDGKVMLTGTVRSWPERVDVERAAWSASGVTSVDDRLAVVAW